MLQTMSQHFRIGGITGDRSWDALERDCRRAMDRAYAEGRAPKYGGPWLIRIRPGEVTANCTRLYGDGTNTEDLSRAEMQGREDMMSILEIFRRDISDFRSAYVLVSGCEIGVRETRRITGDCRITAADVLECRRQPDPVALGSWPIDIHPADGRVGVHPHKENPPRPYPIPSRALIARNLSNLLVAGRCLSATHDAHGSTRVSGTAMATGEAAGTLAALSARDRRQPRDIPYSTLAEQLRAQGALLEFAEEN